MWYNTFNYHQWSFYGIYESKMPQDGAARAMILADTGFSQRHTGWIFGYQQTIIQYVIHCYKWTGSYTGRSRKDRRRCMYYTRERWSLQRLERSPKSDRYIFWGSYQFDWGILSKLRRKLAEKDVRSFPLVLGFISITKWTRN